MTRPPLPTGCQDIKSAATYLGMTHKALLNLLRSRGWIINAPGRPTHNLPTRRCESAGLLTRADRAYCLKGKKDIVRMYQISLLTPKGIAELAKMTNQINETPNFILISTNHESIDHKTNANCCRPLDKKEKTQQVNTKEREKCISQLREWGLFN